MKTTKSFVSGLPGKAERYKIEARVRETPILKEYAAVENETEKVKTSG